MTAEQIEAAAKCTLAAREQVLRGGPPNAVIHGLARTAQNWLEPTNKWRLRAIETAPATTGFSREMIREAIDLTFGAITEGALRELPVAVRPRLIAHFLAGNVPAPGIASICRGLLTKSANLVKVSSRDPVFPALFVESLREVDAELADCVAVLDWRRGDVAATRAALAEADAVVAYGDDETIAVLRRMCGPETQFLGYGHKLSFAVIAKEALTKTSLVSWAEAAAFDASVYDQQGCLSPHAFYVEEGGQLSPREFAAALADAMAVYQERVPRGQLTVEEAAQVAKLRGAYEFRAASDKRVAIWAGGPANDWLVIYEDDPMFTPSCLNRVVFVKPVAQLGSIPQLVRPFARNLSTVGLAPMNERATALAGELAKIDAVRICPIGQMQRPPLSWHLQG
jgi:hypothetical protein